MRVLSQPAASDGRWAQTTGDGWQPNDPPAIRGPRLHELLGVDPITTADPKEPNRDKHHTNSCAEARR